MKTLLCRTLALLALALFPLSVVRAQNAGDVVWIEGEAPASMAPATLKPEITDVGQPTYLSGGKWLHINVDAKDVEKQVPEDGIHLTYNFSAPKEGNYQLWDRIGFENARSAFDWRVDQGAWKTVSPDDSGTDVMQLQTWNPVAWLQLGAQQLSSGAHTIEIRLPRHKDDKGNYTSVQYASDAFAITTAGFRPNGPYKPGDMTWQTDADKAAASQTFTIAGPNGAAQTATSLKGDWQIARDDEGALADPSGPIKTVPAADALFWKAQAVPGNRDAAHPEWLHSHRYLLRTRVNVPASAAGHSMFLHFPSLSMIATVWVNGQPCGWDKTPFAVWDCDITKAVKPGQVNDVWVGIKDWFYALPNQGATEGGHLRYIPTDWVTKFGPATFTFPVWNHTDNGILAEPSLVVAGKAYTSDVFAIPSVKNKTLGLEVTVTNPTAQDVTVGITNEVSPLSGGAAEKTFAPKDLTVPAGQSAVLKLSEGWDSPKLWWPDDPQQYNVVTRLSINGQPADERTTKFGFREWTWQGSNFALNGVPFHGRADLFDYARADEEAVKSWKAHGQTYQRMWGEGAFSGLEPQQALDFYDSHGVPIRRTGIFDGEAFGYNLTEQAQVNGKTVEVARRDLFDNWHNQLVAWARGQRNHPSIFIWSMENEITFINSRNAGHDPQTDPEMKKASDLLSAMDPTRPQMTDGGNALMDQSLPVYGGHYMEPSFQSLPEGAYDKAGFAHRQDPPWPVTEIKPILLGEAYYAAGNELADLATIGGEAAFVGKAESHPAIGLIGKMLSEGYRWNDVNFHFWLGGESDLYYNSWQPRAALCRQWDWTFGSGQKVKRTLGIFNDAHDAAPISLTWTLTVGGKKAASSTTVHKVAPGGNEKFDVTVPMPRVASRQEGTWTLALSVGGKSVFKDVKDVSVLPSGNPPTPSSGGTRVGARPPRPFLSCSPRTGGGGVIVYDPSGAVGAFLTGQGVAFTPVKSLNALPAGGKVLIVGPDALDVATSTSSKLAAYASSGRTVVVLEQKNPLKYQGLPFAMDSAANQGAVAFSENLASPIFRGLEQKDLLAWGPDSYVYRNAYAKPTSGGKSLVECDWRLQNTALAEMPAGKGDLLLSQLLIGSKLASSAVAQQLLLNMIAYGETFGQSHRAVTVAASDNPQLIKALDASNLQYGKVADPLEAISKPGGIAIINATPANLHALASNLSKVAAFTQGGGWIVFNNLTPDGLADYNKIVGVPHLIRPYGKEKVSFPAARDPLTAGLATSNIVMGSGQQIFNWSAGQYPDTDAYSYVVDYDDVAPFGKSTFSSYGNIVNNFTNADGWPLIINFPTPADGKPYDIPITLPRPEKIEEFKWVGNTNYYPETKVNLLFDGGQTASFDTLPNGDLQTFLVTPPRAAQTVTLQMAAWDVVPDKAANLGIDNIYLKAYRSPEFYKKVRPMLNIGAMMDYPRGKGGLVLCNVKYKDSESVPENADKKRLILSTILRNLDAPFAGGKSIIAGANLEYQPVDISKQANQYRTERGWFGDKNFTFADLPTGKHVFGGVSYDVYDFATSPIPTAIMLGGNGIPNNLPDHVDGIPVNRKADALFFLQAARIDQRRNRDELRDNRKFEMADYVVHYADGQTVKVPIYSEISVDNYQQETPTAVPGAQIAWTKPYAGTKNTAVAYSMQWNNPRPDVAIQSIDLIYGPDRRGVPALLAITAATARQ